MGRPRNVEQEVEIQETLLPQTERFLSRVRALKNQESANQRRELIIKFIRFNDKEVF